MKQWQTQGANCELCNLLNGWIFPEGEEFPQPAHPHCDCIYVDAPPDAIPTPYTWSTLPEFFVTHWQEYTAYLMTNNLPVPPALMELIQLASTITTNDASGATTTNNDTSDGQTAETENLPVGATTTNDDASANNPDPTTTNDGAEELPDSSLFRLQAELLNTPGPLEIAARFVRAGRTRSVSGYPDGVMIPESVLIAAAPKFIGVSVFLNHEYKAPTMPRDMRDFAGTITQAHYDPQERAILGTISPANTDAGIQLQAISESLRALRLAGRALPDVGLSMDAWWSTRDGQATSINQVNTVDLVHGPASDGRILSQAITATAQPTGDLPNMPTEETTLHPATPDPSAAAWLATLSQQVTSTVLANSGLPQASRERLALGTYTSPDALVTAIESEKAYLATLAAANVIQLGGVAPRGVVTQGQMTTGHDHMTNAIEFLFGVQGATLPEPTLRSPQLLYFAITGDYEWHGVFKPERVMFANANTTTLANLSVNAMNKVIISQMARLAQYRWYERIVTLTPNNGSVQPLQLITYGGIGELPTVAEGQPYTEMDVDDVKETASFLKKGGYVAITQEMFRNSDIQRFRLIPTSLTNAAIKTRSKAVSNIFTVNSGVGPTLAQDSTALFHADHGNIGTTAFSITEWAVIEVESYKHSEVNSDDRIGLLPKYGLFPIDLYRAALVAFGYGEGYPTTYLPEARDFGPENPRPVPLAVPHWTDTNNYGYIVDPVLHPVIHMSFAQDPGGMAHPNPELFVQAGGETAGMMFSNDALPIKVRDWFAVGVNGPRGIGKRNVA